MSKYRTIVTIPADNGLARDAAVMTFAFGGVGAATEAGAELNHNALLDFFNLTHAGATVPLWAHLSSDLNAGAVVMRSYDLDAAEPRVPLLEETVGFGGTGNNVAPREVALCLSFRAAYESGQPKARYRGRIFFGPLEWDALDSVTGRPIASLINSLKGAGAFLMGQAVGWSVASRTPGPAYTLRPVVAGWVDNSFDTQRRRGVLPTTRATF